MGVSITDIIDTKYCVHCTVCSVQHMCSQRYNVKTVQCVHMNNCKSKNHMYCYTLHGYNVRCNCTVYNDCVKQCLACTVCTYE